MKIIINKENNNKRIDKILPEILSKPRSQVQKLIASELIFVNGSNVKNNYKLNEGDEVEIKEVEESKVIVSHQKMDLNIVFEDEHLLVVNKPSNMVVHPAPGHYTNTLVNGLQYYSDSLSDVNGEFRPGIVHRIDKNTSGLLIVAKTNETHNILSKMISDKEVKREYKAIIHGKMIEREAVIKAPIGRNQQDRKKMSVTEKNSKFAQTNVKVIDYNELYTLVKCELQTGRTHQIRVHLKYINHPVVGDPEYGPKKTIDTIGQALHAYRLSFEHPITKEKLEFIAELPTEFKKTLDIVGLSDEV